MMKSAKPRLDEPVTFRPGGVRIVAYTVVFALAALTIVIGYYLPEELVWTPFQVITLAVVIGGIMALLHSAARSKVSAQAGGVEVVNGYRKRFFAWCDIAGFTMRADAAFATLITADDDLVMVFAIQRSDGRVAREAVQQLAARLKQARTS